MDTTIYVALSHQLALRRQMDLVANNMANANTAGFRRENAVFSSYLDVEPFAPRPTRRVEYVLDHGIARDSAPGEMNTTGNPLDAAIVGEGYFTVSLPNGQTAYTRNGHFELNANGDLVTTDGAKVLDSNGRPISIASDERNVRIEGDGSIHAQSSEIAALGLVKFADDNALTRLGDTLYAGGMPQKLGAGDIKIVGGALEGSNVQPIVETTRMIDVLRTYQATTKIMDSYEDMRRRGIERLGRVN